MAYEQLKPYNDFSIKASQNGGPEKYLNMIRMDGFQKGILTMIPVCVATTVLMYKKGPQIRRFCKEKLHLVSRTDVKMAEQELIKKGDSESTEIN